MSAFTALNYKSNSTRTEGEMKVAVEDDTAATKQIPGAGVPETTLTIASGSVTPSGGGPGIFSIDTEAAAASDDLTNIIQTNIPDGSFLLLRCANAARVVTVKHAAGGSGQVSLRSSADLALNITTNWLMLKRTGTLWEEVLRSGAEYLASSTVSADPVVALGVASKQYADQHGFTTGDVKLTLKTAADTAWILMNDTSIGSAASGATGRANADTEPLYTLLWTNIVNTWAPVAGGRGGSAAADFAANKALTLPKSLGRALAGYGTGTSVATGLDADVDLTGNTLAVPSNNAKWITGMPVVFTLASGTITGLTHSTTYYVIRSSATLLQLASSLVNAQNGTAIDFTAKSSPVWTLTHTYTARVLGEQAGEQDHAQSLSELIGHSHSYGRSAGAGGGGGTCGDAPGAGVSNGATNQAGGATPMNILQPTLFLNVMVKL